VNQLNNENLNSFYASPGFTGGVLLPNMFDRLVLLLNSISIICTVFIFYLYQRQKINVMLRTCCATVLLKNFVIFSGVFVNRESGQPLFQAALISYCSVCIHAHLSLMMLNNCIMALGWQKKVFKSSFCKTWMFILIAFLYPTIPCLMIATTLLTDFHLRTIEVGSFINVVSDEYGIYTSCHCALFFIPGIFCAYYLLYRILKSRVKLGKFTSQIGKRELLQYSFAISLYFLYGLVSLIPYSKARIMAEAFIDSSPISTKQSIVHVFSSSFGILIFVMYGFSSSAKKEYTKMYSLLRKKNHLTSRRMSTVPLIEQSSNNNTATNYK
jgi:hypothetical protein